MMILVLVLVLCIFLFFVGGERGAIVVTTLAGNVCVLAVTIILFSKWDANFSNYFSCNDTNQLYYINPTKWEKSENLVCTCKRVRNYAFSFSSHCNNCIHY